MYLYGVESTTFDLFFFQQATRFLFSQKDKNSFLLAQNIYSSNQLSFLRPIAVFC